MYDDDNNAPTVFVVVIKIIKMWNMILLRVGDFFSLCDLNFKLMENIQIASEFSEGNLWIERRAISTLNGIYIAFQIAIFAYLDDNLIFI